MPFTLLIGGARSGKSSLAVSRARTWSTASGAQGVAGTPGRTVAFVATGVAGDEEMKQRIARHQEERDSGWLTIEAPDNLLAGVRLATGHGPTTMVVIDCLSFWVANRLMHDEGSEPSSDAATDSDRWQECERNLAEELIEVAHVLHEHPAPSVIVTNEVGSGLVPETVLGRQFRDILGRINAVASLAADEAFLVVAGRTLELSKP